MLPLENAKYFARATGSSFGTSSNGNTQIAVHFEVVDGPHAGESISWTGTFTDKATEFTVKALNALGWFGDDLSELDNLDRDGAARLLPDQVELACEPETYKEEERLRVKWVNKPGAGRLKFKDELTGSGLKAFAASMKTTLRSLGAKPKNGSAAGNGSKAKPVDDGDLPF